MLVLKYPRSLENRQRRADYRMQLDAGHPVTVAFCEGDMEGPFRQGIWYSGLAQDISAGGVAILTYQTLDSVMECGSSVQMSFQLPGEEDHVDIAGIIRHCRPCEEEEEEDEVPVVGSVLGVEFVPEEGSQEAVRQIDVIRRFVVARQREGLRKLRLL